MEQYAAVLCLKWLDVGAHHQLRKVDRRNRAILIKRIAATIRKPQCSKHARRPYTKLHRLALRSVNNGQVTLHRRSEASHTQQRVSDGWRPSGPADQASSDETQAASSKGESARAERRVQSAAPTTDQEKALGGNDLDVQLLAAAGSTPGPRGAHLGRPQTSVSSCAITSNVIETAAGRRCWSPVERFLTLSTYQPSICHGPAHSSKLTPSKQHDVQRPPATLDERSLSTISKNSSIKNSMEELCISDAQANFDHIIRRLSRLSGISQCATSTLGSRQHFGAKMPLY
ncbi:hypothetical protein MRB53_037942 [Persea americana]|nr:hypothetical protein MRB53_037942 [Persea americana]